MNDVAVIIPWRDSGCPHRLRNFRFTIKQIKRMLPDAIFRVVDADPDKPFNRGESRNDGVIAEASVLVFVDADTIPEELPLKEAIYECQQDGKLHLPYDWYRALTPSATKKALRGLPLCEQKAEIEQGYATGGVMVLTPSAYWRAGGMPELEGWGFEDTIFRICCDAILGDTVKHSGTIHHLWHPMEWDLDSEDYKRNRAVGEAYAAVEGNRVEIERLISRRDS